MTYDHLTMRPGLFDRQKKKDTFFSLHGKKRRTVVLQGGSAFYSGAHVVGDIVYVSGQVAVCGKVSVAVEGGTSVSYQGVRAQYYCSGCSAVWARGAYICKDMASCDYQISFERGYNLLPVPEWP